jgi:hypothetical protein
MIISHRFSTERRSQTFSKVVVVVAVLIHTGIKPNARSKLF